MNVSDVVRRVRTSAGDNAGLQFDQATIADWINDAIRECVVENSLLQARANGATVSNQSDYTLPADIFKLHSVICNSQKLELITLEQFEERFISDDSSDNGTPKVCYVYAGVLTLYPTPDTNGVGNLTINYTQMPATITYDNTGQVFTPDDLGIPAQFHSRIVTYCLAQVALQDDDYAKYQALMQEFSTGVAVLKDTQNTGEDDLYGFISVGLRDMGDGYYV
jgi:hypothetical protein